MANERNGKAGEVRSTVVRTVLDLKGLLFLLVETSLGDPGRGSTGEGCYHIFKAVIEIFPFPSTPENSLISCTSLKDLMKMTEET